MKTIFIAVLAIAPCFAQEAKIMIVEKADSQKLARAYQDYKDALKHWEDAKAQVAKQYTEERGKPIQGWEKIQFSADFRAIVPESSQYASRAYCGVFGNVNTISSVPIGTTGALAYDSATSTLTADSGIAADLTVKEGR